MVLRKRTNKKIEAKDKYEDTPLFDAVNNEQFDVVISNGAFCLASDKAAAFREIHRVLRPGGKFSVACTTTRAGGMWSTGW